MKSANPILIVLSIFIPIIGIVLFFTKKDSEPGPANTYLWSGLGAFIVYFLMYLSVM